MSAELPVGWAEVELKSLVPADGVLTDGDWVESKDQDPDGDVRLIQLADIGDGFFRNKSHRFLTSKRAVSLGCTFLKAGDILIARMPDPLGRACIFPLAGAEKYVTVVDVCIVRVSDLTVSNRYLTYAINSLAIRHKIEALESGTTRKRISGKNLAGVRIPLAPLKEQQRIVAKIEELFSELDKGIENLKLARAQLAVYRQALLKHAFEGRLTADWRAANADRLETGVQLHARIRLDRATTYRSIPTDELKDLPGIPSEWVYASFGTFIETITAGKSFSCDERRPHKDEVGVAKVSAVTWGEYDETESKTCTDPTKINPSYFIEPNDFILSRANTIELVGACVIVKRVAQRIMLSDKTLRLKIHGVSQGYVLRYLRSILGRKEIMGRSTGNQESMRNIGQDGIRSIAIPVCSPAEAEEILNLLEGQLD